MRPYVIVHSALSLDGRTDRFMGDMGLYYEIAAKMEPDATLTGSDTLLMADMSPDGPDLDELLDKPDGLQLLVVTDSQGRVRHWRGLQNQPYWGDIVVLCSDRTPDDYLTYLRRVGVETIRTSGEKVDLSYALSELTERFGVRKVRVDSGGALATALLQANLVDELVVMIFPYMVGGTSTKRFYLSPEPDDDDVLRLEMIRSQRLRGGVQLLRYRIVGR